MAVAGMTVDTSATAGFRSWDNMMGRTTFCPRRHMLAEHAMRHISHRHKQIVSASRFRLPYSECDTSRQGRCHAQTESGRIRNLAFRIHETVDASHGTNGSTDFDLETVQDFEGIVERHVPIDNTSSCLDGPATASVALICQSDRYCCSIAPSQFLFEATSPWSQSPEA